MSKFTFTPKLLNLKGLEPNSKNSSKKPTLIIDLRPIQNSKVNGVYISSLNFIQDLIDSQKYSIVFWSNQLKKTILPEKLKKQNIQHIQTRIPNKILNLILAKTKLIKIDKLIKYQADIYFCPDLRPFHLSKKTKSYLYIHDIAFKLYPNFYSKKSKLWYKLINPKKIYKKANAILCNSKFTKSELLKHYGIQNIEVYRPHLEKNWSKFANIEIKENKPYIFSISSLQPRKNLKNLIAAFEIFNKNSKYNLIIAGPQENIFPHENLKLDRNIKFLGEISEDLKKNYIQKAALLAYIPIYEGFGLPILEALELKTKVLASKLEVFKEIYKEHINYCEASDPKEIARKISEILE